MYSYSVVIDSNISLFLLFKQAHLVIKLSYISS
jgi:hypothetical protein